MHKFDKVDETDQFLERYNLPNSHKKIKAYTLVQTHKNIQHQIVDLKVNYNIWVIKAMGYIVIGEAMHVRGQGKYRNSLYLHFSFAVKLKLF